MTEAEALAQLKLMTAWTTDPQLSGDDLNAILSTCRLADSEGRAPDDEDWEPTYDLNLGAAIGYETKAGRSTDHHQTSVDGRTISAQQVHDQCLAMARHYRKKRVGTLTTTNAST